jgi:hypothetical protein
MITLTREEAQKVEQYIKPYAIVPVDMQTTQLLVNALRAKLSEPKPEPVAWMWDVYNGAGYSSRGIGFQQTDIPFAKHTPLYTAPPQREWVGLTDDEVNKWELPESPTVYEFAQFVEAKLKEKNNG